MIILWGIGGDVVIVYYANKKCGLDVEDFIYKVIFPLAETTLIMLIAGCIPVFLMEESFGRLLITCLSTTMGMFLASALFAISREEKAQLYKVGGQFVPGFRRNKGQ